MRLEANKPLHDNYFTGSKKPLIEFNERALQKKERRFNHYIHCRRIPSP